MGEGTVNRPRPAVSERSAIFVVRAFGVRTAEPCMKADLAAVEPERRPATKPATQKTRRLAKEEAEALRQEAADTRAFTEATPGYVENRSLPTELERARMRLEDQYSERMRSATP